MSVLPNDFIRQFLDALGAWDIVKAQRMLPHDFEMTLPDGVVFHELEQLIEWLKPRYKLISKTFENLMTYLTKKNLLFIVSGLYQGNGTIVDYSRAFNSLTGFKLSMGN